jgi:transglutaminase-like putative cysteine protease
MTFTLPSGRRIPLAPAEGWLTLGLVLLLCLSLAWALDDALLVLGQDEFTDFLAWTAIGGVLAGYLGAAAHWGRWRTYLIGAIFAALLTPVLVGWVLIPEGDAPGVLFHAAAEAAWGAWEDLVVLDRLSTVQYGHHLLVLGLIVWGSSMFASFAAFGHRRPINAALLIGILLVTNMALTTRDQLVYLVVYSLAALLLLIRFHTFDEQAEWIRRRIGDPAAISGLYLRGGTIFIVATVTGALLLTTFAQSAPLAGAWTNVGGRVIEWGQFLQRYLPESGSGRSIGPAFGSTISIGGVWTTDDGIALTYTGASPGTHAPYLAAVYADRFVLGGWRASETTSIERPPGEDLLVGLAEDSGTVGRQEYSISIAPRTVRSLVFAPENPIRIHDAVTAEVVGEDGYLFQLQRSASSSSYLVAALTPADEDEGGITENKLRVAGQDYPAGMQARYGQAAIPAGTFDTAESRALRDEMKRAGGGNPYDTAAAIVRTLQDGSRFVYDTDVRDVGCTYASVVDCFAVHKRGYCEYYASTMAMILRSMDIPARLVEGFRPGERDAASGVTTVRNSDAHAWVQVYFPRYGWVAFDPTGGDRAALAPLPSGPPEPSASTGPKPSASAGPRDEQLRRDIDEPGGSVTGSSSSTGAGVGPFIAVALLLGMAAMALATVAWRRGPRGTISAEGAYGMVARLAGRAGLAPRPDQTVYEFADALGDVLPDARPELQVVAHAKVEVTYGRRQLGDDRLAVLAEAQRRLRNSLIRLLFRRGPRRSRPGR